MKRSKKIILIIISFVFIAGVIIFVAVKYEKNKSLKSLKEQFHVSEMSKYYQEYADKCLKTYMPSCCLSSIDSAEAQNSLLFESNDGGMNIDAKCPDGYQLDMNKCKTSYIWCSKK